tara:strand:+ start:193 stop:1134 length:942 start_codon:yes stop_codon:yes gene_type:complete
MADNNNLIDRVKIRLAKEYLNTPNNRKYYSTLPEEKRAAIVQELVNEEKEKIKAGKKVDEDLEKRQQKRKEFEERKGKRATGFKDLIKGTKLTGTDRKIAVGVKERAKINTNLTDKYTKLMAKETKTFVRKAPDKKGKSVIIEYIPTKSKELDNLERQLNKVAPNSKAFIAAKNKRKKLLQISGPETAASRQTSTMLKEADRKVDKTPTQQQISIQEELKRTKEAEKIKAASIKEKGKKPGAYKQRYINIKGEQRNYRASRKNLSQSFYTMTNPVGTGQNEVRFRPNVSTLPSGGFGGSLTPIQRLTARYKKR